MAVFERRTRLPASLESAWRFHTRIEGLLAVTPDWMRLRVDAVRDAEGEPDPERLAAGTTIELSMRPLGLGPRQRWTTRIVESERRTDGAWFRDEMVEGPFPHWIHTHRFHADGAETIMTDRVEYRLPVLPGPFAPLGHPFLSVLFAYRHRETRRLLAGGAP